MKTWTGRLIVFDDFDPDSSRHWLFFAYYSAECKGRALKKGYMKGPWDHSPKKTNAGMEKKVQGVHRV